MIYTQSNRVNSDKKKLSLVFIHGNSMNSDLFLPQVNSKKFQDYNCLAMDLPGHGKSDKSEDYSISSLVNKVAEKIANLERFLLVGHSLGGQIAIHLLRKFPSKCKGIVLISTPPIDPKYEISEIYNINETSLLLLKNDLKQNDIIALQNYMYPKSDKWSTIIENSIKYTDPDFRTGYASSLMELSALNEVEILNHFKGSILIVSGEEDSLLSQSYLKMVCEKLKIDLKLINHAGHFPHIEDSEKINNLILSQINQIER